MGTLCEFSADERVCQGRRSGLRRFAPLLIALPALGTLGGAAAGDPHDRHFHFKVLPGRYALIGQHPDGGATYQGDAEIADQGGRLTLVKRIGGETTVAEGTVERADPGEADVLRLRWPGHEETCLVRLDLDNYARLSCHWSGPEPAHRRPGLEAYFATETWP
jgi:hypothetical protein